MCRTLVLIAALGCTAISATAAQLSQPGVTHLDARGVVVSVIADSLDGVHFKAKIRHKKDWHFFNARFDPAAVLTWLDAVAGMTQAQSPVLTGMGGSRGVVLVKGDKGKTGWALQRLEEDQPLVIKADRQFNDTLLAALRLAAGLSAIDSAAFASGLVAPIEEQPDSVDPVVISIPTPVFPPDLAAQDVQGLVLVRYVVDANGETDASTIEPLWASQVEFIPPVRHALAQGRFQPARLNGQPVRRRVYQNIHFRQFGRRVTWN
jgi:hypothetical protein